MRGVNEFKTNRARHLRSAATDAEGALWQKLRSRRLNGFKFVRQEPVGPFTVDFIGREGRLILEVDGGQHADTPRDVARDRWLASHNYRVMRFWNNDVLANMAGVLEVIANALAEAPLTRIANAIRPLPASGARLSFPVSNTPFCICILRIPAMRSLRALEPDC